jgi:hypothetical protein
MGSCRRSELADKPGRNKMHDHFIYMVTTVVGLTLVWAIGAVIIALYMPTPPSIAMERLFETFLALAAAGFFTVLSLLATHHGPGGQRHQEGQPLRPIGAMP